MIRIKKSVSLRSLKEGEGFIYGDCIEGFYYCVLIDKKYGVQKVLADVKSPGTHSDLSRFRPYALDTTNNPQVIPVTLQPFAKVKVGTFFFSIPGALCKRLREEDSCWADCFYPDGKKGTTFPHHFDEQLDVFVPDFSRVIITEE